MLIYRGMASEFSSVPKAPDLGTPTRETAFRPRLLCPVTPSPRISLQPINQQLIDLVNTVPALESSMQLITHKVDMNVYIVV